MKNLVDMKDFLKWILNHLPMEQEEDLLIILKAHLLSEALLNEFISSNLLHSNFIENSRLNYSQRIAVARSLIESKNDKDWVWGALKDLNCIRNKYAHKLEPDVSTPLEKFISKINNLVTKKLGEDRFSPCSSAVVSLLAELYGVLYYNTYNK